ncbi:peptidoglycan-recognition protein LF-like [Macrosteles quadrilineatus]|uniref:peptidoglycan-recognition protein LF-like n=1 Tax=Macrosteles quadrilineatus TaxID=74068 RepID=UPI0023E2B23B|nr:peptidoglycan-recognition protein LF-like [Macrosteles quadrilineatus]
MEELNVRPDRPGTKVTIDLPKTSPLDEKVTIITRDEWGAEAPVWETALPWLPSFVRIIHTDAPTACADRESCIRDLKEQQKKDKEDGFADINFNFLVGEGGTIYEGRGWKLDHELPNEYMEVQGKCISIAYMGDYKYELPPWEKMVGAFNLLVYGINHKLVSPFMDFQHLVFDKSAG